MERAQSAVKAHLQERQRTEDAARRHASGDAAVKRLDDEAAALRRLNLRPAALAAGLAEIERERQDLMDRANGRQNQKDARASQLLARLPEIMAAFRERIISGAKPLAKAGVRRGGKGSHAAHASRWPYNVGAQ